MDNSLIKELKLRLVTIKQDLAKIEDENGLNFWTGSKYQIEELLSLKQEFLDFENKSKSEFHE